MATTLEELYDAYWRYKQERCGPDVKWADIIDALLDRLVRGRLALELLEAGVLAHTALLRRHAGSLGRQLRQGALVVARHDFHELRKEFVPVALDLPRLMASKSSSTRRLA